jgi:hypothetical protein
MKLYKPLEKNEGNNDDTNFERKNDNLIQNGLTHKFNEYKQFDNKFFFKNLKSGHIQNLFKKHELIRYQQSTSDYVTGINGQKNTEIHFFLLILFFLFVTIITITQIIIMHSANTSNADYNQLKAIQEELKIMDTSIDEMLKEKYVLPMQMWYPLKRYYNNIIKFKQMLFDSYHVSNHDYSCYDYENIISLSKNIDEFYFNTSYFYKFINSYYKKGI